MWTMDVGIIRVASMEAPDRSLEEASHGQILKILDVVVPSKSRRV